MKSTDFTRRMNKGSLVAGLLVVGLHLTAATAQAQGWNSVGNMTTPRDAHAALVGGRVLIMGGRTNTSGVTTRSTNYYDPASAKFTAAGNMVYDRGFFLPVLLDNGLVLAAGGFRYNPWGGGPTSSAELFNPTTGIWQTTGSMRAAREMYTATKLGNGMVLFAGGFNGTPLSSCELYTPSRARFGATGTMLAKRFGHTATLLKDGRVLVTGGRTSSSVSHRTTEIYNPLTGTWSLGPDMHHDRYRHTATTLSDGRILITGGYSSTAKDIIATVEIFDPANPAAGFVLLKSTMSDTRMDHTATLLTHKLLPDGSVAPDGRVLIIGGWSSTVEATEPYDSTVATAEIFDPATDSFVPAPALPISRHEHTASLLPDGRTVLVLGGLQWEPFGKQALSDAYVWAIP
jgi:hypothetical protein